MLKQEFSIADPVHSPSGKKPNRRHPLALGMQAVRLLGSAVGIVLLASPVARAASYSWWLSPGQSGDWQTASNWTSAVVPGSADAVYILNGGTATVSSLTQSCVTLTLGVGAGGGNVNMTSGSLNASSYEYLGYSGRGASHSPAGPTP